MTLPTSPPISLIDVLTELRVVNPGRSLPISLGDADVRNLAGKPSGAISLSDLYGKSSYIPMTVQASGDSASGNSQISGGTLVCHPIVSVTNGRGNKTINWRVISASGGPVLTNPTSISPTVTQTFGKTSQGSSSMDLQADATDATGATVSSNIVTVYFDWG